MNVFRDGVIAFFSAVGMTTVVWLLAGAVLHAGRPTIPGLLLVLVLTAVVVYDALVIFWHNPDPVKSVTAILVLCILGCSFLEPYLFGTYVTNQPIQFLFLLLSGYLDCWRAELREAK